MSAAVHSVFKDENKQRHFTLSALCIKQAQLVHVTHLVLSNISQIQPGTHCVSGD